MKILIFVFLGGGLGSLARYLIGKWSLALFDTSFPLGTIIANVVSCIVLGLVLVYTAREQVHADLVPFLIIGFCGGFSTFSTFSYETVKLAIEGRWVLAILNIALSLVSCFLILFAFVKQAK